LAIQPQVCNKLSVQCSVYTTAMYIYALSTVQVHSAAWPSAAILLSYVADPSVSTMHASALQNCQH